MRGSSFQLFFNPNHEVCYITDNEWMTEGIWEVRNDTLFIYEYFEIEEEPECFKILPDSIRFSELFLPSYRDLTWWRNRDEYHYPANHSIFTIKDGGNIIMSVCDDLNSQGRVCSKIAYDKTIPYWFMVDRQWLKGREVTPASLTWDSASVEWPAGVMTVKECVEDSLGMQFVVVSRDSMTYKVMNPAAFRYPLAEPWRRRAEDWISEAGVGRAERLVLYPVDSISTVDIPVSELRYRRLNT